MKKVIKKTVSMILVFMTVFSAFTILPSEVFHSVAVKAAEIFSSETSADETYSTEDFTYTLIDEYTKVKILSYIGDSMDVVIPDTIDGKKVTAIGDGVFRDKAITSVVFSKNLVTIGASAFYNCDALENVVIPDSVETIGNYAFYDCSALTSVEMGDGLQTIGESAFYNCQALVDVDFGSSVKVIGVRAFKMCKSIKTLNFPDSLETIGNYAFTPYSNDTWNNYYGSSITEINFGKGIKTIGYGAFYNCDNITAVEIGESLTSIGDSAFYDCDGIKSVNISGTNATIGQYAFYACNGIENVEIEKGVKIIGNYAFYSCNALKTVNLSNDVTTIGSYTFYACSSISELVIPDSVTTIGGCAFQECTGIKNISIGSGCSSIPSTAFLNLNALENIVVSDENATYSSYDGVLLNKEKTSIIIYPKARQGAYIVPDTVTAIADNAFHNCDALTEITIGNGVKTIGVTAFAYCDALEKATIGDGVETIGNSAFASCSSLTSVEMGDGLQTIGESAFYNCQALVDVDFGSSVKVIGVRAFKMCKSIKTLNFPDSLETIGNYAFTPYSNDTWNNYYGSSITEINFGKGIKTIGYGAFYNCDNITAVEIGESLTSIGDSAFYDCDGIKSVNISGTNATIGQYAFYACNGIENVEIEKGVKIIGNYAFYSCNALKTVNLSNDVTTIGNSAFYNCSSLETITLGKGLTSIASNAITGYSNLTVYCYEDTYAHEYSKNLSNVTIKFVLDNYFVRDLTLTQLSSNSVKFEWKKPNGFDDIENYIIYKNGEKYDETTYTSYTDTKLETGVEYKYSVSAVNSDGVISEQKTLIVTPACSSVKSISLPNSTNYIGGAKKIKLTATMNDSLSKTGATGKFLYSADGEAFKDACEANVNSNETDYIGYWDLTDIETGKYTLRFLFTDKDGGQSFTDVEVNVDRTHPAKIDELTVVPKETSISLSWQISKEYDTTIYRIYRRAESETEFELISEIRDRNKTTYTDTKVAENVTYYYYVVGTDEYGQESKTYEVVSAGLINDIVPPSFIKMTPATNSYIYGKTRFTVNATDNVGVAKVELYYSYDVDAAEEDWTLLSTHNGSTFSEYVDTTVINTGLVYIKAKIYDAVGNSTYSYAYAYSCDNQGPEKVKNVECVSVGGTIATLSWDNVADDDIQYYIVEQKLEDGTFKNVYRTGSYLGANLTKLVPETEYTYRIVGYDKRDNRGEASDEITFKTTTDTVKPAVSSFSPAPGYYSKSIPLRLIAIDDYQVKSIKIQTSADKLMWTDVTELTAESLMSSYAFEYSLDISKYKEGSFYVRAIVTDSFGNETESDKASCYEYVADRTPSETPAGLTASSDENYVSLSWNPVTGDESFSHYRVYRSSEENGEYKLIKNNLTTVNTYDTNVEYGNTYFYKIDSVDKAGNVSELSKAVSCKVKDDEEKPQIYDVYPANESVISAKNCEITVSASDNAKLANLKVEYKTNALLSSYTTLKEITGNTKSNCTITTKLPIADFDNGTEVTLRVTASDAAGNVADEKIAVYTVDTLAPTVKDLTISKAEGDKNEFTLKWSVENGDDAVCYYIYKQTSTDSSYVLYDTVLASTGVAGYSYTDDSFGITSKNVKYKVEAYDKVGNTSSVETETMTLTGLAKPIPIIHCPSTVVVESEYLFDATESYDDVEITSYKFDFGDGTEIVTNDNGKAIHAYAQQGTYTLVLTVTDSDGNSETKTKEITATSRDLVGTITVNVVDDNKKSMPDTPVYVNLGESTEQYAFTDQNGNATFELPVGTHTVASYKTDYLPVKQQVAVTGSNTVVQLVLVNEPIVTGEFEIHKMTFDEIVAAGIDIKAAENRNVVRIDVTLMYEKQPVKSTVYWNGVKAYAEPVYVNTNAGTRKLTPYVIGGGSGSSSSGGGYSSTEYTENPTVVYIDVPVDMSFLKDFFSVSLHIVNHASSDFSLLNNNVKLNVPDGLTIMKTDVSEPEANVYIPEIKGQSQETVKWILRGDKPGTYDISADFLGKLSYFNEPVSATFVADEPIEVVNSSSLKVTVEASETTYRGKIFYDVIVENEGPYEYNDFSWESPIESYIDQYVDVNGNAYEMTEQRKVLKPGEKFIYHFAEEIGSGYKFLGSMVDDFSNSGATVNVLSRDTKSFLELYFLVFPEESGAYVFTVMDKNENIIEGATITINEDTKLTTNEKGIALLDDRDIECKTLTVSKDGYYDYVESGYNCYKWGNGDAITLYKEGEYALVSVDLAGRNTLERSAPIEVTRTNSDGTPLRISFNSFIYGDVEKVEITQNGNVIKPVSTGANKSTHIYTNTYTVDQFTPSTTVSIEVTAIVSGKKTIYTENLKVSVTKFVKPDIEIPDLKGMTIQIDNSVEFLGGISMDLDFPGYESISRVYNPEERTITYAINNDINDLSDEKFKEFYAQLLMDYAEFEEGLEKGFESGVGDTAFDFSFGIEGTLTLKIKDDGSVVFHKSTLELSLTAGVSKDITFVVYAIPFNLCIELEGTASVTLGVTYEDNKFDFGIESFGFGAELCVSFGIGCPVVSAGIYGKLGTEIQFAVSDGVFCNEITASGELGLYAKFFIFREDFTIVSFESKVIYERNKSKSKMLSPVLSNVYEEENYNLNTDLMKHNSVWNTPIASGEEVTTLLSNSYAGEKAQIITCGDTTVMVYLGVDSKADSVENSLALFSSVYNKETGKWGVPTKLDDNNLIDMDYSLCNDGENIYVVYTQSNKKFDQSVTMEEMAKSADVYSAVFDANAKKFTSPVRITENEVFDSTPVVKNINGVVTAAWVQNSANNFFLNDNNNSIVVSKLENGEWTTPVTVQNNVSAVTTLDIADSGKNYSVVYTTDNDNDLSTTEDKTLWVYSCEGSKLTELAKELQTDVTVAEILDNTVALWYEDGKLMQYDFAKANASEICEVSASVANGFEFVSDTNGNYAVVYTESKTEVKAIYLDTATLQWSEPVSLVKSNDNIENLSAQYVDGKLTLMYDETTVKMGDEQNSVKSDFVTVSVPLNAKADIVSATVDFDTVVPSGKADMTVKIVNNGATPTGELIFNVVNYDGTKLGTYTTSGKSLATGESDEIELQFTVPENVINRDITVYVTDSSKSYTSSYKINLGVSDLEVESRQITQDGKEYISAVVSNNLYYATSAKLEVYNRLTDEVYYTTNVSDIKNGTPKTVLVELDESYVDADGMISVRVVSKAEDYYNFNDSDIFEYRKSVVDSNEYISYVRLSNELLAKFDESVTEYSLLVDNVDATEISAVLSNENYTVETERNGNIVTLKLYDNNNSVVKTYTFELIEKSTELEKLSEIIKKAESFTENVVSADLKTKLETAIENAKAFVSSGEIDKSVYDEIYSVVEKAIDLLLLVGDANLDGNVSVLDATIIQKYLVGLTSLSTNAAVAAESNEDGKLSILDATLIQKYLIGYDGALIGKYTEKAAYTITFTNELSWTGDMYCYSWRDGGVGDIKWPGQKMTYVGTDENGKAQYTVDLATDVDNIIFNNKFKQTVDIKFDSKKLNYATTSEKSGTKYCYKNW